MIDPCPFGESQWCQFCGTEEAEILPFDLGACAKCLGDPEHAAECERWRIAMLEGAGQMRLIE